MTLHSLQRTPSKVQSATDDIVFERYEHYKFDGYDIEWIALHDEEKWFKNFNNEEPVIAYHHKCDKIRANLAWQALPKANKECMVAHEMGHKYLKHAEHENSGLIKRTIQLINGIAPECEVEADAFAVKLIGYRRYLEFMWNHFDEVPQERNQLLKLADLKLRIDALENR